MNIDNNLIDIDLLKEYAHKKGLKFKSLDYSDKPNKKYVVINDNNKIIHFGSINHKDFLIYKITDGVEKAKIRRDLYRNRHKNENYNDIDTPSYWSWHLLW